MSTPEILYRNACQLIEALHPHLGADTPLSPAACALLDAAVRYARIRTDWERMNHDARREMNDDRTQAHDTFIDACNLLAGAMATESMPVAWRKQLGDDRKLIGDFACFLHCALGVRAR